MVTFMREERETMLSKMETLQSQAVDAKVQAATLEARLREQAVEARLEGRLREQAAEAKHREGAAAVGLQARLQAIHAAELLTEEQLYAIEDTIADSAADPDDDRVSQMVALSVRMAGDPALARQLRRKFA